MCGPCYDHEHEEQLDYADLATQDINCYQVKKARVYFEIQPSQIVLYIQASQMVLYI